jgi:hypothetical protein
MHDPMQALPDEAVERPSPWASLAQQARWLADLADRYATADPLDLQPSSDEDGQHDPLADIDARALAIRSVAAACRRATWQALNDRGARPAEIAARWGVSRQNVSQILAGKDRPR